MKCCKAVARLPESIVEHHLFKDVATIDLSRANLVALPERFGQLENLRELDMAACKSLLSLPDSFCNLSSLIKLSLGDYRGGCEKLASLPERFGQLESLQELNMAGCKRLLSLPDSVCDLSNLKTLVLGQGGFGGAGGCEKLESLPERFGDLTSLKELSLYDCPARRNMPAALKGQLQAQGCRI